jgi:hypothetical protein
MNDLYGITGLRVKVIVIESEKDYPLNAFLEKHDGKIIDIKIAGQTLGYTTFVITYKQGG